MKTNQSALDIIKKYEGLHDGDLTDIGITPKLDPIGIWTEGYGRAMTDRSGNFLTSKNYTYKKICSLATIHTIEEAEDALIQDLLKYEEQLESLLIKNKIEVNENQFSALISLVYNIGIGNFKSSSILKYLKEKKYQEAANSFLKWNKAKVNNELKELKGLTLRRQSERELFLKD